MYQMLAHRLGLLALALLLAACSGAPGAPASAPTGAPAGALAAPTTPPASPPESGRTTVTGQIISTRTNGPLANHVVRLAEVINEDFGDGDRPFIFNEATSPGGRTDDQGRFVIANITAQEYVMIISNDIGNNVVITKSDGTAEVWNPQADQILDVGSVRVDFP